MIQAISFIETTDIESKIKEMQENNTSTRFLQEGNRAWIAIVQKNSSEYAQYKEKLLQTSMTMNNVDYAVVYGVEKPVN